MRWIYLSYNWNWAKIGTSSCKSVSYALPLRQMPMQLQAWLFVFWAVVLVWAVEATCYLPSLCPVLPSPLSWTPEDQPGLTPSWPGCCGGLPTPQLQGTERESEQSCIPSPEPGQLKVTTYLVCFHFPRWKRERSPKLPDLLRGAGNWAGKAENRDSHSGVLEETILAGQDTGYFSVRVRM